MLHEVLQVRFGLKWWRRWVIGSFIRVPRWLHRALRIRGKVLA